MATMGGKIMAYSQFANIIPPKSITSENSRNKMPIPCLKAIKQTTLRTRRLFRVEKFNSNVSDESGFYRTLLSRSLVYTFGILILIVIMKKCYFETFRILLDFFSFFFFFLLLSKKTFLIFDFNVVVKAVI